MLHENIVTVSADLLNGMIMHPYHKDPLQQFINDAQNIHGKI
jgi:hypothetical protein